MKKTIRIGTRGSQLALWQANFIKNQIEKQFSSIKTEIVTIKTTGDKIVDRPLAMVGGKGLFVKEIEAALMENEIDLAVHSMKDMPGHLPDGLIIGAVPARENPVDVLISNQGLSLPELPEGAVIGTSSLRRASQIRHQRPGIYCESIRGNLDTRLKKLARGDFDAIILAAAGLIRLGMADVITQFLEPQVMLPAVGQGALCIETRENDPAIEPVLEALNHRPTQIAVQGERAFLRRLEGSCHIPVACFGEFKSGDQLTLTGLVASENGETLVKETLSTTPDQARTAGTELADRVLLKGGRTILENLNI